MLEKLVIPPDTRFEERNIVVEGDVIVGPNSKLAYGIIARKIVVGERVNIDGDLVGDEVRLDAWCNVSGNVVSRGDAYIGEFVSIGGKLTVFGDLEIGRNVKIKNGFEAKGLITIQDPMPVVMFLFLYLLVLLRLGKLEDVEKLFEEVEEFQSPLVIPENSYIDLDKIEVNKDSEISGSKVIGNLRIRDAYIDGCEVFGSVRGREIVIDGSIVHGAVWGKIVYLVNSSEVYGKIKADKVYMEEGCSVEGSILAREGVWIKERIDVPFEAETIARIEEREIEELKMKEEEKAETAKTEIKDVKESEKMEVAEGAEKGAEAIEDVEEGEDVRGSENGDESDGSGEVDGVGQREV